MESLPSTASVSPAAHTLITIAKVAFPVTLSQRKAKALSPVRKDWQKHFIAGAIICGATVLTSQGLLYAYNKRHGNKMSTIKINMLASLAGFIASVSAGITKELYDKECKCGNPEVEDAVYTATGGMFVSASVAITLELIFARRTRTAPQRF